MLAVRARGDRVGAAIAPALLFVGLAVAGCGQDANDATVRGVTGRFLHAVGSGDGTVACAQLSPQTRSQLEQSEGRQCRVAITNLKLDSSPVTSVQIFVQNAIVQLAGGETEFLEQGAEGWRLSAVGCMPQGGKPSDHPYNCKLQD
jgi:hypothetical protein